MIFDETANLEKYYPVCESLRNLSSVLSSPAEDMETFDVNRKYCTLFVCEEDGGQAAVSWRENSITKDVLAALSLTKGTFALFLPGERFIFRGSARVRKYVLE